MNEQSQGVTEKALDTARGDHGDGHGGHGHVIHFFVDGEREETTQTMWTPNQIIRKFGDKDPATHYLVQIHGHVSYEGKGDTEIKIHNAEKFQIVSTGPTTVSDNAVHRATVLFMDGLRTLGYAPIILADHPDHVFFDYEVQSGRFAAKQVRIGFVVPADFPMTPPSGPHLSPTIHLTQAGGAHPNGGIHDSATFTAATKQAWQYWSRPFPNWGATKKTVADYMGHLRRLWDTQ